MFKKALISITPRPLPSESPSPPSVSVPVLQPNGTDPTPNPAISPPSPKRQKMAPAPTKTPARTPAKTPGKQKQSRLTPYAVGDGKRMAFKPATSTGKSSSAKKGGNTSILSFFKPSTPTDAKTPVRGAAKSGKVAGAQSDDLFIRHGGYELDLSEPEGEEEDGDGGDESAWSVERALAGELELAKRDGDLYSSPVRGKHGRPSLLGRDEEDDEDDVVMSEDVVDEIESTAPTTDISPGNPTTTRAETSGGGVLESALKFNPTSLKLDGSRSFLFSKKGPIPAPFKKLKRSSSNLSTEETNSNGQENEETGPVDDRTNRSIGESIVKKPEEAEVEKITPKTTREQAFMKESTGMVETSSDSLTKEEEEEDTTPEAEEKLESCNITPRARKREGSAFEEFEEEEYEDIEDFSEELNFEEQEAYRFDPASRAEAGYEDFDGDLEYIENLPKTDEIEDSTPTEAGAVRCPVCAINIGALPENDKNDHVNQCLDGTPIPLPTTPSKPILLPPKSGAAKLISPFFGRAPVITPSSSSRPSAFAKLMSTNSESQAWASAAKAEIDSRGKKAADRTCPFYKILFNGPVTVDAFRYGAVPGCRAYFLSHFHSDHYIGLSSKWAHGPIYCSRVTANLVRSKLGVDPKYVCELAWEEWTDFGVGGIRVRGLDANHCPGSMLFLFEETRKGGKRILHCGDFRARPEHLRHPLLAPGKEGLNGQKIDVVYLDTTYLNPKYAFPAQSSVIEACAAMCVKLQKEASTGISEPTPARNSTLTYFITPAATTPALKPTPTKKPPGRLLIIVGTYSIGKERLCLGIAQALKTKIFAPPNKLQLCHQLEDPLLARLLTSNPREAQVHMTPLMDLQLPSLQEYLSTFRPHFDRIVGFRPTGWTYRPPSTGTRATEAPSVAAVLHGEAWRSPYGLAQMAPARGSGGGVACYAVPYSEHSSFRELTMFCCALNVGRVVPTVNVGSAKRRGEMMDWVKRWEAEKRKAGLFVLGDGKGRW